MAIVCARVCVRVCVSAVATFKQKLRPPIHHKLLTAEMHVNDVVIIEGVKRAPSDGFAKLTLAPVVASRKFLKRLLLLLLVFFSCQPQ